MASNLEGDRSLVVVNCRPSAQNWRMEVASHYRRLNRWIPVHGRPSCGICARGTT